MGNERGTCKLGGGGASQQGCWSGSGLQEHWPILCTFGGSMRQSLNNSMAAAQPTLSVQDRPGCDVQHLGCYPTFCPCSRGHRLPEKRQLQRYARHLPCPGGDWPEARSSAPKRTACAIPPTTHWSVLCISEPLCSSGTLGGVIAADNHSGAGSCLPVFLTCWL